MRKRKTLAAIDPLIPRTALDSFRLCESLIVVDSIAEFDRTRRLKIKRKLVKLFIIIIILLNSEMPLKHLFTTPAISHNFLVEIN